jgi:probable phosphoglycerate mutase
MDVILVRHAEPKVARSESEPVDPELTERGLWQAERVCAWLGSEPIDAVVTSTKKRAIDTVAPLADRLGIAAQRVPGFDEIDRLARFYAPFQLIPKHFPEYFEAMQRGDWEWLGWDDPSAFRDRVVAAWQALVAQPPGDRVVVGCHGGTIGVIVAHVLALGNQVSVATPPFACLTRLRVGADGGAQVLSVNEDGHFDATRERPVGWEGEGYPEDHAIENTVLRAR